MNKLIAIREASAAKAAAIGSLQSSLEYVQSQITATESAARTCPQGSVQAIRVSSTLRELHGERERILEALPRAVQDAQAARDALALAEMDAQREMSISMRPGIAIERLAGLLAEGAGVVRAAEAIGVDPTYINWSRPIDLMESGAGHFREQSGNLQNAFGNKLFSLFRQKIMEGWNDGLAMSSYPRLARIQKADRWENIEAGVDLAELATPTEGTASPAMTFVTASTGADIITMRANGLTLTTQEIYNCSGDALLQRFYSTGLLCRRTLDRLVSSAISGATWTNATQVLALNSTNITTALAAHRTTNLSDAKGIPPARFLVSPSDLIPTARTVLAADSGTNDGGVVPVCAAELGVATTWYLASDPRSLSAFTLIQPPWQNAPLLEPVAAGLVSAYRWRIELPAKVVVAYQSAGKPAGWRQFT